MGRCLSSMAARTFIAGTHFLSAEKRLAPTFTLTTLASMHIICHCVSLRLSQVGVLLKWLNIGSRKQRHMIAQGLVF